MNTTKILVVGELPDPSVLHEIQQTLKQNEQQIIIVSNDTDIFKEPIPLKLTDELVLPIKVKPDILNIKNRDKKHFRGLSNRHKY